MVNIDNLQNKSEFSGVDVFLHLGAAYRTVRFGLVTNHAATTANYMPSRKALREAGLNLIKLFSPEHGLDAVGEDGRPMKNGIDALTGIPIVSLYGDKLQPSSGDLADIDAVLLDLPDIGCRFYTYLWTLTYVMEACEKNNKLLIVLDRPNPISGDLKRAEGPMLDEVFCSSFIGRWNIPLRHSCTFGELATYWQQERMPDLKLEVIRCEGWDRFSMQSFFGRSFVPTSPAMVSHEAALLYPGLGLLEATNISDGRGTATPFRIAGAPWIEAIELAEAYNKLAIPGLILRAITFLPLEGKYHDEPCEGVMFHVTDPVIFKPVFAALVFIKLVKDLFPQSFSWATYPTHVNPTGDKHLDRLLGIRDAESLFNIQPDEFLETVLSLLAVEEWGERMKLYQLY